MASAIFVFCCATNWQGAMSAPSSSSFLRARHVEHTGGGAGSEALSRVMLGLEDLVAAGGVYIYHSDELLVAARAPALEWKSSRSVAAAANTAELTSPLFPLSGGQGVDGLSQYGLDALLIRLLQDSPYTTDNPDTAALFVVPQYATFEAHWCMGGGSPLLECSANISRDYLLPLVREVQRSSAYRRNNGRDHVWIFPWDSSWTLFPGAPEALTTNLFWGYIGPSENVVITPVTSRVAASVEVVERNTILGGNSERRFSTGLLARPGAVTACVTLPPHKYLASFAGTIHESRSYSKGLRQDLLATYPESTVDTTRVLILARHMGIDEYSAMLRDSLFCLSPQGWTPWSQRLYYAIAAGCIPVFFDIPGFNVQLPYTTLLPWSAMSITVPVDQATRVHDVLRAVPPETVCRMRGLLAQMAPLLTWATSPHTALMAALSEAWHRAANATSRK